MSAKHDSRADENVPDRIGFGSKAVVTGDVTQSICRAVTRAA